MNPEQLSQEFVRCAKSQQKTEHLTKSLTQLHSEELFIKPNRVKSLLAFWLNIYNGLAAEAAIPLPCNYFHSPIRRQFHFNKSRVQIASVHLSLNDIEHTILRGQSLTLRNPLKPLKNIPVNWQFSPMDFRIHFALNCGGKSCPAIQFYSSSQIDNQLNTATQTYLQNTTTVATDSITVSSLLKWYQKDFPSEGGIKKVLIDYQAISPSEKELSIQFAPYDWSNYFCT